MVRLVSPGGVWARPLTVVEPESWEAMLGEDEREATEHEVAALEAAHEPFLPADGEG